ncbi:hypothetical protein [Serratia marcescens]|uniref:hypothetical protein n=1 Tax=Serratia marcescens TaxID=615 RepID=UPI0039894121
MFKYQADIQNARDLAKNYLSAVGMKGTPEEYIETLRNLEKEFLSLLRKSENNYRTSR